MDRDEYRARGDSFQARFFWLGAGLAGVVACGGASSGELWKPTGQGGQASQQGGTGGTAAGGEPPTVGDAGVAGQVSSGGELGMAGTGAAADGGATTGGTEGTATGGTAAGGTISGAGGNAAMGGMAGKASGGRAGASAGGQAGAGGVGSGGAATGGSGAGAGGAPATCPGKCDANAECAIVAGDATCTCRSGFVGNGRKCTRPSSCQELHEATPNLASGPYLLRPSAANADFTAYCEMSAEGGGWTLVLNSGPAFEPTVQGAADAVCYRENCTSLAYSTVPVSADVMLDIRDGAIVAANYVARVIVTGIDARSRGKTVRELFNSGPYYLEKEDNSNLTVRLSGSGTCSEALPSDMAGLVCNSCAAGTTCSAPVITFGDTDPGCVDDPTFAFAIGGSESYTTPWSNCAGWPQQPNILEFNYYPDNVRVWIR